MIDALTRACEVVCEDEEGGGDPEQRRIKKDTKCLSRTASFEQTGKMGQDGPLYLTSHRDCI